MIVAVYGSIFFTVSDKRLFLINDVARQSSIRIEEHQVTGAKPRVEFIAPNLDQISFTITLMSNFGVDPMLEIERLRIYCLEGQVHHLIIGYMNFGRFILTEVSDSLNKTLNSGKVTHAQVDVSFKEYL